MREKRYNIAGRGAALVLWDMHRSGAGQHRAGPGHPPNKGGLHFQVWKSGQG